MKENCTSLYPNELVAGRVSEYADRNSAALPDALLRYHRWVLDTQPRAEMTISLLEARLLTWLARTVGAQRVLEVGVFVGFSLAAWAHAVGPAGSVTGIEQSAEYAALATEQLRARGFPNCAVLVDDALRLLPRLCPEEPFDVVFIDAQKAAYPDYLAAVLDASQPGAARRLLRPGGLIVGDNALRAGLVVDQSDDNPAAREVPGEGPRWDREAMRRLNEFNRTMRSHERIDAVLLPVFDGLSMGRLLD